ncbi:DoxX family protein [Nocardia sp. NPDC059180]|uniref:DoxX family protein n=1 Tax=Nocardia sp. NPDC059180 TaxID=3346761 RepID=UPI0036D01423
MLGVQRSAIPVAAAGFRARTIVYWVTTLIVVAESIIGGVWDVTRTDYIRDVVEAQLGYPWFLPVIIGVCKIPGALVLLAPRMPRLKEWAYAGMVFIYIGASASHFAEGNIQAGIGPLGFTALTLTSWALRPVSRRDLGHRPWVPMRGWIDGARNPIIGYWIFTTIIGFVLLSGGIADVVRRAGTSAGVLELGYPAYFLTILGVWKVLGVCALLAPGLPRLKEWAYAGTFYMFAGAFISHLIVGSAVNHPIWTGLFAVCTIMSWILRPDNRVVEGPAAVRSVAKVAVV